MPEYTSPMPAPDILRALNIPCADFPHFPERPSFSNRFDETDLAAIFDMPVDSPFTIVDFAVAGYQGSTTRTVCMLWLTVRDAPPLETSHQLSTAVSVDLLEGTDLTDPTTVRDLSIELMGQMMNSQLTQKKLGVLLLKRHIEAAMAAADAENGPQPTHVGTQTVN